MEMVNEISKTRLIKHLQDEKTLAMISTYRSERANGEPKTERENRSDLQELKRIVRDKLNLGFIELVARWVETNEKTGESEASDERSLMVFNISLQDAMELGNKYEQSSIIFKSKDKCAEVCTTPFTDYEGKRHNVDDVIRMFDTKSNTMLKLNLAKDIFEKRIGGPASQIVKGKHVFSLKSLYVAEKSNPDAVSECEKLNRIF